MALYGFRIFCFSMWLVVLVMLGGAIISETAWDRDFPSPSLTYRISNTLIYDDRTPLETASSSSTLLPLIEFSGLDGLSAVRVVPTNGEVVWKQVSLRPQILRSDGSFLNVFPYACVLGNCDNFALNGGVLITQDMKQRLFGANDAVGETVLLNDTETFEVVGVISGPSARSHLQFDAVVRSDISTYSNSKSLEDLDVRTYARIPTPSERSAFLLAIKNINNEHAETIPIPGRSALKLDTFPLPNIYLDGWRAEDGIRVGGRTTVNILTAALLALSILAFADYANFSLNRLLSDTRKYGLQSALGAPKRLIFTSFIFRSSREVAAIVAVALALFFLATPLVEAFLDIDRTSMLVVVKSYRFVLGLGFTIIFLVLVGALYPTLIMGRVPPAMLLGERGLFAWSQFTSRAIAIVQFSFAGALITAAILMTLQIENIVRNPRGLQTDGRIIVSFDTASHDAGLTRSFAERVRRLPSIAGVGTTSIYPSIPWHSVTNVGLRGDPTSTQYTVSGHAVSPEFIDALGVKLIAGEPLRLNRAARPTSGDLTAQGEAPVELINITRHTARTLGFDDPSDAIGAILDKLQVVDSQRAVEVVGVVEDFQLRTAKDEPELLALYHAPTEEYLVLVNVADGAKTGEVITLLQQTYSDLIPASPMPYALFSDLMRRTTQAEARVGRIFTVFATFGILLSTLSVLAFSMERLRTDRRNIAIRRTLGAPALDITALCTNAIASPVIIGATVGGIAALIAGEAWLGSFVNRISIPYWLILASPSLLAIVSLIVSTLAISVFLRSPPIKILVR